MPHSFRSHTIPHVFVYFSTLLDVSMHAGGQECDAGGFGSLPTAPPFHHRLQEGARQVPVDIHTSIPHNCCTIMPEAQLRRKYVAHGSIPGCMAAVKQWKMLHGKDRPRTNTFSA